MINYTWKIIEVFAENERVKKVRYSCDANNDINRVFTEGHYTFKQDQQNCDYHQITEKLLVHWMHLDMAESERVAIESNLAKQLEKPISPSNPPWHVETFKVTL